MPDAEWWLFRPVAEGVLDPVRLIDGSIDLEFVAALNDMLDVKDENQARWRKANPS